MSSKPRPILGDLFHRFPLQERTVPNLLQDAAARFGDRIFASLAGREIRFSDVPLIAARVAGVFHSLDVKSGETVALFMHNCPEFMGSIWGQAWNGGVAVPINPAIRGPGLAHVINDSDANVIVCDADLLHKLDELGAALTNLRYIIVVGTSDSIDTGRYEKLAWDSLLEAAVPIELTQVRFDDPVMIMYTSGTTGLAKGVIVSHHQYYCSATLCADNQHWGPDDHLYTPLQLCHAQAHLNVVAAGLVAGSQVTLPRRFSARNFWAEIAESGATHANAGSAVNVIGNQPPSDREQAHRLRALLCNPPPIDIQKFQKRFNVTVFSQGYGMTEGFFVPRIAYQYDRARNCVGLPSPLFSIDIFDESDIPVPHDGVSVGEIVARPLQPAVMMSGYYKNPAATADAFRNLWFHTGDIAAIDEEGLIYLHGRKKDSIRRRGENISAVEIENAALSHPLVSQAAAFGVPSPLGEHDVKLDLVLVEGGTLTAEEMVSHLETMLATFMIPRFIQFRLVMPMTPTERIEKYKLQAEGCDAADHDGEAGQFARAARH
ncbi:MAG: hypothetical protein EON58_11040 [Alphaproteobacteria bacterium]|nr:MAG: hypothetical protein EON58_11040 [Alphaproteobacteria bacterium]